MNKVKFSDKVIIHNLDDTDDFRKSAWDMYARDRLRFQKRISELKKIIDPVLNNLLMKQKINAIKIKKNVNKTLC
jgi:uncharacterized coiled-coil DUF342 family protein